MMDYGSKEWNTLTVLGTGIYAVGKCQVGTCAEVRQVTVYDAQGHEVGYARYAKGEDRYGCAVFNAMGSYLGHVDFFGDVVDAQGRKVGCVLRDYWSKYSTLLDEIFLLEADARALGPKVGSTHVYKFVAGLTAPPNSTEAAGAALLLLLL
jgi:hypothetical protein